MIGTRINQVNLNLGPAFTDANPLGGSVQVTATGLDGTTETFTIQTADWGYRPDLGCRIKDDPSQDVGIDTADKPEFNWDAVIEAANNFMASCVAIEPAGTVTMQGQPIVWIVTPRNVTVVATDWRGDSIDGPFRQHRIQSILDFFDTRAEARAYCQRNGLRTSNPPV